MGSGAGAPLVAIAVERHGADDDQALDDQLPDLADIHQDQAVGQHGDDQRADQRAEDGPDAADEAGAAQDDRGDRVQLVAHAQLGAVGGEGAGGGHDAGKAGQQTRHAVDEHQHGPDLDARQPGRVRVAADAVDPDAQHGPAQDEPAHRDHQQRDHHHPGDTEDLGV